MILLEHNSHHLAKIKEEFVKLVLRDYIVYIVYILLKITVKLIFSQAIVENVTFWTIFETLRSRHW